MACQFFDFEAWNYGDTEYFLRTSAVQMADQHKSHTEDRENVLDVCCGRGLMIQTLKESGFKNLYGVDGSEKMLWHCELESLIPKENLFFHDFSTGDFDPNKKFNHITIHAGISFIENINKLFMNMNNILNEGGVISFNFRERIAQDKTQEDEFGTYHEDTYVNCGYKFYLHPKNKIENIIENCGFKTIETKDYQFGTSHLIDGVLITARKK